MGNPYQQAGVDVAAGYEGVKRIAKHVKSTNRKGVMGHLGSFGGLFDLSKLDYKKPVLVSGTDGVGTKLMVAKAAGIHDTIGIDCVAMCVNDVLAQGAEPLFFLDYIAIGKNDPTVVEAIVKGISEGCVQANTGLIGGETAEMSGMYEDDEYDLAGFTVGAAEKNQLLDGSDINDGDILIGLPSSGIHSNGYSLVRKLFFEDHAYQLDDTPNELGGQKIKEALLAPTKIYVQEVLPLIKAGLINGIAHITGGGFVENIPRMLPATLSAEIQLGTWPIQPIFSFMEKIGSIEHQMMYEIFNMGIGMVLAVSPKNVDSIISRLNEKGNTGYMIGRVVKDSAPIVLLEAVK